MTLLRAPPSPDIDERQLSRTRRPRFLACSHQAAATTVLYFPTLAADELPAGDDAFRAYTQHNKVSQYSLIDEFQVKFHACDDAILLSEYYH